MLKSLDLFGFGPSFIRWIETFHTNISSCVINNGLSTSYFQLERGVRQGDPLSNYLFIVTVEISAIAIRSRTDIHGIKIGKAEEFKMVQCADDLTVFVSNVESAQRIFQLLDQFRSCFGLRVNYTKTEIFMFRIIILYILFIVKIFYDKLEDIRM